MNLELNDIETPIQKQAYERLKGLGLPSTKDEDWKYTSLKKFMNTPLSLNTSSVDAKALVKTILPKLPECDSVILFINGSYHPELSCLAEGLNVSPNETPRTDHEDALTLLRSMSPTQQLTISIEQKSQHKINLINLLSSDHAILSVPKIKMEVGTFSDVELVSVNFTMNEVQGHGELPLLEIALEDEAQLVHIDLHHGINQRWSIAQRNISLKRNSRAHYLGVLLGGAITRLNLDITHNDSGSHSSVDGLYALQGSEHADIFSTISHLKAHTTSSQLVKGVLADQSRGVFTGKVSIARDAQQVDAQQLNKNLLLGTKAQVNTRPQLEVDADDVKCAHGATIGQLSEDELFYLQSRGFTQERARKMLCHAFIQEVLEQVPKERLAKWIGSYVDEEFEKKSGVL